MVVRVRARPCSLGTAVRKSQVVTILDRCSRSRDGAQTLTYLLLMRPESRDLAYCARSDVRSVSFQNVNFSWEKIKHAYDLRRYGQQCVLGATRLYCSDSSILEFSSYDLGPVLE